MEKLLKYLIVIIKTFWNDIAIIQGDKSIKYSSLIKEVITLSITLNTFWRKDKKLRVAICADNSIEWIISFLGTIFSNNTLILISPSLGVTKILHILSVSETNILITDIGRLQQDNTYVKGFKGIILYTKFVRKYSASNKTLNLYNIYKEIIRNTIFRKKGVDLIIYTPNRLEEINISFLEVFAILKELKYKEIFEPDSNYLAFPEFSYNYLIGLLLPLISGTKIVIIPTFNDTKISVHNIKYHIDKYKPPVLIITANQFNQLYLEYIQLSKCTFKEIFKTFFSFKFSIQFSEAIIKERLYKLFPEIKKLIILNSSISFEREKLLKKIKFPYTITYGTVETCGIATYSHPSEFKLESVGREIIGNIPIENNIIYHNNKSLGDIGLKDINGNIHFASRSSDYNIQSRKIEELLKENIPFIEECVLHQSLTPKENPYLLVNINLDEAEIVGLTNKDEVINIINNFIEKLNLPISRVIIWKSKFQKDSYDRIVKI